MNTQKMLRALNYHFRSIFLEEPESNEALFRSLKHCISLFDPEWVSQLRPSSEASIRRLAEMVERDFGKPLPPSYKLYLQEMGANGGELLLRYMMKLDYYSAITPFQTLRDRELLHYTPGDMAESPIVCRKKAKEKPDVLWYLLPKEVGLYGFWFTLHDDHPDEIVMGSEYSSIVTDTFPKQLAYCEYLKAIHWIEENSQHMKRSKWNFQGSDGSNSLFSACFRVYCPYPWDLSDDEEMVSPIFPLYTGFLERLEARFFLEEAWFSRQKVFPSFDCIWVDDYHTFFSRYIAFHPMSDLTLLMELHLRHQPDYYYTFSNSKQYWPFIQVHLLGKDVEELNEIIDMILQEAPLLNSLADSSRMFGKLDLE